MSEDRAEHSTDCVAYSQQVVTPVFLNHLYHMLSEAAGLASAAEASSSCNTVSRVRTLKQPEATHKAGLPKPRIQSKHEAS